MEDAKKIVTLDTFYDPMQAEIIFGVLADHGLACYIADDLALQLRPYLNQAMGGVSIRVFESDLELCRKILAWQMPAGHLIGAEQADVITDQVCPFCGSANVRFGAATQPKFHLPSLILSLFFFLPLYFRNAWHCFNCYRDFE